MHGRLEIRVAEALDDDPVDVRNLPIHRLRPIHADNRADADGRVDRRPEMKLVRGVGLPLRRDYASQCFAHEMALRNSSQSLTPYAILSHRTSGSERGVVSAMIHLDISLARSDGRARSATSTRTQPQSGSRPASPRSPRYQ